MKKKTLLLTTLAGTMLVAGMTATGVKAAVGENAKAIVREEANGTGTAYVELVNSKYVLNKADITELINKKYVDAGIAGTKVADVKVGETAVEEGGAVGTGATVELNNNRKLTVVVYGDVTGEGEVTTVDAKRTLEGGLESPYSEAADVANGGTKTVDAKRILEYSTQGTKFEDNFVDSENEKTDNILGNMKTVNFIDTESNKEYPRKTDMNGNFTAESAPKLEDSTGAKVLYGWSTKMNAKYDDESVIKAENLVGTKANSSALYSVWIDNVEEVVRLHKSATTDPETVGTYTAGETIELPQDVNKTSAYSGVSYEQDGWFYVEDGKVVRSNGNKFEVPVIEKEDTAEEEESTIYVDLYPAWNVTVSSLSNWTNTELSKLYNEIKTSVPKQGAAGSDDKYCADIVIDSDVTLSGETTIYDGITIEFKDKVTINEKMTMEAVPVLTEENADDAVPTVVKFDGDVTFGPKASLTTRGVEIGADATFTKQISSESVEVANDGNTLNDSLNNTLYNRVELAGAQKNVSLNEGVEITNKSAILDLKGKNLMFNMWNSFKIAENANLKIINTDSSTYKTIILGDSGLVNNGTLVIGDETSQKFTNITKSSAVDSITAPVVTNAGILEMNSGVIVKYDGETKPAVENTENGKLNIVDASITVAKDVAQPALLNDGTATILRGTIKRSADTDDYACEVVTNHGTLDIKGGVFETLKEGQSTTKVRLIENGYDNSKEGLGNGYNKAEGAEGKAVKLTVTGGTFNGGKYAIENDYAGIAEIKGGIYNIKNASSDPITNSVTETRSVFKNVGDLTIDLREATKDNTCINMGDNKDDVKTKLVIVGDENLTIAESKENEMTNNTVTVYPFDYKLIKTSDEEVYTEEEIKDFISAEKSKDSKRAKSVININIVSDGTANAATNAGKELLAIMANLGNRDSVLNSENNSVNIILNTDVEIPLAEAEVPAPGYKLTKENTTLNLNGHKMKIHALYIFSNNAKVVANGGSLVLQHGEHEEQSLLDEEGNLLSSDQLKAIADAEQAKKEEVNS